MNYPKHPAEIDVLVSRNTANEDQAGAQVDRSKTNLQELLDTWLMRMGYTSIHIKNVVTQLLTSGKVQVVFRKHTDRFELGPQEEFISTAQALSLLEDYASQQAHANVPPPSPALPTQRIAAPMPERRTD
jgi:hypothetical protein